MARIIPRRNPLAASNAIIAGSGVVNLDIVPSAFIFNDVSSVALGTQQISNIIVVSGINGPSPISVTNGEYNVNGGAYTSVAGTVVNGDQVRVRHTSSPLNNTAVTTTLTIGGVSDSFTSTTLATVSSPSWSQTPININFVNGVAGSFDLRPYLSNFTVGSHGVWIASGSLPSGVTLNTNLYQLDYDGLGAVTSVSVTFDVGTIADADWYYRINRTGVRSWPTRRFDTQAEFDLGRHKPAGQSTAYYDTTVKVSGNGSLRQEILPTHWAESTADWDINFADVRTQAPFEYRQGDTFYLQFRKRYDLNFLNTRYTGTSSAGWARGLKNFILQCSDPAGFFHGVGGISESPSSSNPGVELTGQMTDQAQALFLYHTNNGKDLAVNTNTSAAGLWTDSNGVPHRGTANDPRYYNMQDRGAGVTNPQQRYAPTRFGVSRDEGGAGVRSISPMTHSGVNPVPPELVYFRLQPEEWMTFEIRVTLGATLGSGATFNGDTVTGFQNSRVQFWGAREGQAPELLVDMTGCISRESGSGASSPGSGLSDGFGKLWLTVFGTDMVGDAGRPVCRTWTDEIIVSTTPIPFPGVRTLPPGIT